MSFISAIEPLNGENYGSWREKVEMGLKGICPRGNNKVVIILFRVHNRCLFLMLELY
jgi:hypothetical protein